MYFTDTSYMCDNLMMVIREICCTDEGDQGLSDGDSLKSQKGVL